MNGCSRGAAIYFAIPVFMYPKKYQYQKTKILGKTAVNGLQILFMYTIVFNIPTFLASKLPKNIKK
jgi:hypothetical protein